MPDSIKLLPEHVANQIAAGEVIQRPASVVKELLDNSIDAGSTEIKLLLKDAGKALIQILDNGKGMSTTDARMCWERHATSKISSVEDIFRIRTMGFRGEALASIASVAQVEMKTRRSEDKLGTFILIEGSEVRKQESVATPTGTSISVKNLFFNIPARRNFLKSNPVELRHILEEFNRAALANPGIAFELWHNDENLFRLKRADLAFRICELFSDKKPGDLLPFDENTSIINTSGYIGKPEVAKKTRGEQFFFVNRRFIKDPYLNHALVSAYENLISKEQFPFYCIHIEIDPGQVDVNIHPTKTEIKFEDERNIYQIIKAVARKTLGAHFIEPPVSSAFDDNQFMHANLNRSGQDKYEDTVVRSFSPVETLKSEYASHRVHQQNRQSNWQPLFDIARTESGQTRLQIDDPENNKRPAPTEINPQLFLQLHLSYIVCQIKSGLIIIDQQAAHERVLYEKYLSSLNGSPAISQQRLFPKAVTLSAADTELLNELLPSIRALGFDINAFGKNAFVINGVPAELHHSHEQQLLEEVVNTYKQNKVQKELRNESIAATLAKQAAIKRGTRLETDEMNRLVDELFACSEPKYSPTGKACILTLTLEELEKLFK